MRHRAHRATEIAPTVLAVALCVACLSVLIACGRASTDVIVPSPTISEKEPGIGTIAWSEASSRIGERQRVEGPVVSVTKRAGTALLNVGADATSPQRFVVVIPAKLLGGLGGSADQLYGGRLVRVTGTIVKRGGTAAIVARSLQDVRVEN